MLGAFALALLLVIPFRANEDDATVVPVLATRPDTVARGDTSSRVTTTAAGAVTPMPATPRPATDTSPPLDTASAPSAFDRFVESRDSSRSESSHRRYTSAGLRELADALETRGASAAGVAAIRAHADSLRMPVARTGAYPDYTRTAFLAVVRELDALQERQGVAVDTARLRATAWAVRPDRRLIAQRGRVRTFFETARDALHALSRRE